ncbi:MAG: SH3 domain-containing protein [bacterium]
MPEQDFIVTATELTLRSEPEVKNANRIDLLPQGQEVHRLADVGNGWWQVKATRQGVQIEGFVSSKYLTPKNEAAPLVSFQSIAAVDLAPKSAITRKSESRAFPLNESNMPTRTAGPNAAVELGKIIQWLNVEHSARYQPKGSTTYCNIYAYDYCCRAGVYMPRVWWSGPALAKLAQGQPVPVKYDETVKEKTANMLCDWFEQFGIDFGWRRTFDLTAMQDHVNNGGVGIIVAQRKELERPGHIVAVVPEIPSHQAIRVDEAVTTTLQSQAGATNRAYSTMRWWTAAKFRKFGLWLHD